MFLICSASSFSVCSKDSIILQLTKEEVQSISVYTYDLGNNKTTINWVYKKSQMEDLLNYLQGLSGFKTESINTADTVNPLYGIKILAGNKYQNILFVGDYAITDKGEYYLIDKEEAEKIFKSTVANTRVNNSIYIYNHRYLSLLNGKWDTKYMIKSRWTEPQMANINMISDKTVVNNQDENLELEIVNSSSSKISFGSQIEIEAMVDDVWYNIDDMINDNIDLGWTLELINLNSGEIFKDNFPNLKFYQPLPKGKYRLIKKISVNENIGYVAYEFDVN
jgi:hypothetical protein